MALRFLAAAPSSDLLTLPWNTSLESWDESIQVPLARGISRHVVRFVRVGRTVVAVKQTRQSWAEREYNLLRNLRRLGLPAVEAVGIVTGRETPEGEPIEPALLTGLSLLHYDGFADCPTLPAVRERVERESPALRRAGIHILVTQQPDGSLILGDTHEYVDTATPFADEDLDELVLREAAALLGAGWLEVRERWVGIYPFAPGENFLVAQPVPGVQVVSVTAGIGMTTALGLAPRVLDGLLSDHDGAATASSGDSPARHADPAVPN